MVTLLHTNCSLDFFLFAVVKVLSGKDNESPVLFDLVRQFVEAVANREHYADGHEETWMLIETKEVGNPRLKYLTLCYASIIQVLLGLEEVYLYYPLLY